jgi:hypothetical protein
MQPANEITLFLTCTRCGLVYQAVQVRVMQAVTGSVDCLACERPLHTWSGLYDYRLWRPAYAGSRVKPPRG